MRDDQFYADKNFQESSEQTFLETRTWHEEDYELLEDVSLLQHHRAFNSLSHEGLKKLFSTLPSLTLDEIYKRTEYFTEFPNGIFKYSYQNICLEELQAKRQRPSLNAYTYTNNKKVQERTFALVDALFDDAELEDQVEAQFAGEIRELQTSSTDLDSKEEDQSIDPSLNSYTYTNNIKSRKRTSVQAKGRKWQMQDDWYSDESMCVQIEYKCRNMGMGDEDLVAEAVLQYWEIKASGGIDYEKEPAYWVRSAVNRMINKMKYDNRDMRRSVDTVSLAEPEVYEVQDRYGSWGDWYRSLTKTQKSAVDAGAQKVEKGQPIKQALRKRLNRVPRPVIGESVQRFGTTNLREAHAAMRPATESGPAEVATTYKRHKAKRRSATMIREMKERATQSAQSTAA